MPGMTSGDILIEGEFRGMHRGRAVVPAGSAAVVYGVIKGDLVVEPGARVLVRGMVKGAVVDLGGEVEIASMVGQIVTA